MSKSVYQFSSEEMETALGVINSAIKNHQKWSDSLHTSIVCGLPFAKDILHEAAHRHCEFGKWYYGEVSESIKSIKEYSALEAVHKYMHSHARDLALIIGHNKKIGEQEYQAFLTNHHHLIDLLTQLRHTLIKHADNFDDVTGVINRKSISLLLEQSFENARRYNQQYSLAMLDVDHFKNINDQFGHVTGDRVLKIIATYFQDALRKSDSIGRYGGEEFLILLPGTTSKQAFNLMDKTRTGICNHKITIENEDIKVNVSIGVAELMKDDEDAWQAVKRADMALYQAKESGRNCVK